MKIFVFIVGTLILFISVNRECLQQKITYHYYSYFPVEAVEYLATNYVKHVSTLPPSNKSLAQMHDLVDSELLANGFPSDKYYITAGSYPGLAYITKKQRFGVYISNKNPTRKVFLFVDLEDFVNSNEPGDISVFPTIVME